MVKTFVREIPKVRLTPQVLEQLQSQGYILIDTPDSVEVWAETMATI